MRYLVSFELQYQEVIRTILPLVCQWEVPDSPIFE
jgi:hypothetical protein